MKAASAALAALVVAATATVADARCTRLAFSVNDYGKVGPTADAKRLLDGHIAKWAAENGVTNYRTGPKSVTCELYLDLIVFDEYTCKAEASVCWGGSGGPATTQTGVTAPASPAPKAPAAERAPPDKKTGTSG